MSVHVEAPQADRLDLVRRVVEGVAEGLAGATALAARTRLAPRYALYALHAARLLELVTSDTAPRCTERGKSLLATPPGSPQEQQVLRDALIASEKLGHFAEAILGEDQPSLTALAEKLQEGASASYSTALRRAQTLLSWRRYLVTGEDQQQLRFAVLDDWAAESDVTAAPAPSVVALEIVESAPVVSGALNQEVNADEASPEGGASDRLESDEVGPASQPLPDTIGPAPTAFEPPQEGAELEPVDVSIEAPQAAAPAPILGSNEISYLRRQIEQGNVVLFLGAGFSLGARNLSGEPLPTGPGFAKELWDLCYPGEPQDGSTLQDIFEFAERRHAKKLAEILRSRFVVDSTTLPEWYKTWFNVPWSRAYTLNVDDLEAAVEQRFDLPRSIVASSALRDRFLAGGETLQMIHLNGSAADGTSGVTFSGEHYAQRLAKQEPLYGQLAAEMLTRPIIFVGSPLEEPIFWQHVALRGLRAIGSDHELRPKSFLVSPTLSRARMEKLRAHNIVHVPATAQEFAAQVLEQIPEACANGHARLRRQVATEAGDERNIVEVADASMEVGRRTAFLLGEEPSWADIRTGRAIERDEDAAIFKKVISYAVPPRPPNEPVPVMTTSATAGAGKTTLLMKLALHLHAAGVRVAWVGSNVDVAPAALTRYFRNAPHPAALIIDDAGRYGSRLPGLLSTLMKDDALKVIVLGIRSYQEHHLIGSSPPLVASRHTIGRLTDPDIDRLLAVLERERRLGALRAQTPEKRRAAFRDRADRQILVAMMEATSGDRFEDKIIAEWQAQAPVAQYVYALTALATTHGHALSRQDILLACAGGAKELEAVEALYSAHLIVLQPNQRYTVRHRVIAEKLLEELVTRGSQLERLVIGLCKALAVQTTGQALRNSQEKRVLKKLLNHTYLLRLLEEIDLAREVYAQIEEQLDGDHHYWLQRGCLELEGGDVRFAQNFIEQAAAINSSDPLVETASAHVRLRNAIASPGGADAEREATESFETLRRLITARGAIDPYPAHVFGSQALGWCRRAGMTPKARLTLLRDAKEIVGRATTLHRSRQELHQLLTDLKREEMRPQ